MKPKRLDFFQYVLVLVVLALPHIASADDPCQGFSDEVNKFVLGMPWLSSSELASGRFKVDNENGKLLISYLVDGNQKLKKEWNKSCPQSDAFCEDTTPEITPIAGIGGYGGLHLAMQARHFAFAARREAE